MNKQELTAMVAEILQTMGQEPMVKGSDYKPTNPGPEAKDTHYQDGDFVFIIENSTKEKSVDLSKIFQRGYSTKGENRGLGLATLVDFQDDYENLSVETSSLDCKFTQVVRVYEGEGQNVE